MNVVIDSNIWISALVYGGQPRKLFERVVQEAWVVSVSEELFTEIRRVLQTKFPDFVDDFNDILSILQPYFNVVRLGSLTVRASRDSDDDFILETAILGNATCIVSGDKDLLSLQVFEKITICTVATILNSGKQPV